jgi:hypothetical protein
LGAPADPGDRPGRLPVTPASTEAGREALLAAALADGRLIEPSVPTWRTSLERDPQRAGADLAGLASARPIASDAARLFPGQVAAE